MKKTKKTLTRVLAVVCAGAMLFGVANIDYSGTGKTSVASATTESVQQINGGLIDTHTEDYFDSDKVYKLTDTVTADTEISVILSLDGGTLLDRYNELDTNMTFSEYSATSAARKAENQIVREETKLVKKLNRSGLDYSMGETYDTLVNGFEITIKAGDFDKLASAVPEATLIVGEEYERCETEVVTNDVDVYDTGIFDSSDSKYNGDGVVVAVLDTGLDYTHSAFAVENFDYETLAYSRTADGTAEGDIESHVGSLHAATTTANLTSSDVYINEKVPYQYDYADKDTDVFPINSEHGTHVSGIIVGKDSVITGVAPSAQLMMMKVFSDSADGAKTSWILAALEDCVRLGVDVINMSLGTSCGFSREVDKENVNEIYDAIQDCGISMLCAAGNDYTATYGSEKNGSLGLTSNPETSTVSSPSSYDATMSVASVSGVATNYMLYGDEVVYFNEATDSTATTRSFFDDIIDRYEKLYGVTVADGDVLDIPYEVIPGLGRNSDYPADDYTGKIVLVKRGTTTFEEKIRIAMQNKNALGIIIYNNVSGDISMSIGSNADAAACSISQDDGEMLASADGGVLRISKSQQAGPFMSDFSSWGPTSDLKIKPEITAHGGDIYSCVPGQGYDRLSGTSMATPNMAGATALIRQYVKEDDGTKFGLGAGDSVTAVVNKLEMSTADIIYNKNGLPYSVRKQGAGLVNLYSAQKSDAYISTLDSSGNETDKAKIELGDDPDMTGVYEMSFYVKNITGSEVSYRVDSLMQTEGVSTTYTSHGDTTVTGEGRALDGTGTEVMDVSGGSQSGNTVTVPSHGSALVTVRLTLSEDDKDYMEESFENGMYVEGFITLKQLEGTSSDGEDFVDLNVPVLAFYGDWLQSPIFDEEYYDTNADEINAGISDEDKLMADGYATRVVGGLYDDYIAYMGTYYFTQDSSAIQVAASKDYIAMSNQSDEYTYNINNLAYVYAGLLRNVKTVDIEITEDATGKVIYTSSVGNQRKSYGTSSIYTSAIDMDGFSANECNLKNNTQYTVTLSAYIDYGYDEETGEIDKMHQDEVNKRNTFSFPLFIDYESPVLTDVEFRTEYDSVTKKTSLYADMYVYDNHYAMAAQVGNVTKYTGNENYLFSLNTFGNYFTPISSSFNSTTLVAIELTDYINDLKDSSGYYIIDGETYGIAGNTNSFIVVLYDYAMNSSVFEVRLPDEIISMYFDGPGVETVTENGVEKSYVTLALNETLDLTQILNVYPSTAWVQTFDYRSTNTSKVAVVNQTVLALDYTTDGPVEIIVTANTQSGGTKEISLYVTVEGDKGYTLPVVNSFSLKGYYVNKAFYSMYSDEREIGYTGYTYDFGSDVSLSMFPSESVTVIYDLQTYFPDNTYVRYTSANSSVATVDEETGEIVAQKEGTTSVTATVYYVNSSGNAVSQRSSRISITVKDPFTTNSIYLMSYKGLGGVVEIPDDRGITTIYQYAFSNYEYVSKDLSAGDVIDDEDPYNTKPWFIGEDTITKIIIPEGVKEIDGYAFAGLTSLEEVVFPSTLTRIGYGAFYGCTSLTTISFSSSNNVQFINDHAFYGCESLEQIELKSAVAIGKYAFAYCDLTTVSLWASCQSVGEGAFMGNANLFSVTIRASSIKLDSYAFAYCTGLEQISVNASVIPSYAFYRCSNLKYVTLGTDVSVINVGAFYGTAVTSFTVPEQSRYLTTNDEATVIYSDGGHVVQAVAPSFSGEITLSDDVTTISNGAFAGTAVTKIIAGGLEYIEDYAFNGCSRLTTLDVQGSALVEIGQYAFYNAGLTSLPALSSNATIGYGAFAYCSLSGTLSIDAGREIGEYAFYGCEGIENVTIADGCVIGAYAFYGCNSLKTVEVGEGCVIGDYAFASSLVPEFFDWYTVYYETYYTYYYSTLYKEYYASFKKSGYSEADCIYYADYYADYDAVIYAVKVYWDSYGTAYASCDYTVNGEDMGYYLGDELFTGTSTLKELFFSYDIYGASYSNLTTVTIGGGTEIGTGAFSNCAKLKSLTLGGEDQTEADIVVGDYAFYNCVSLCPGTKEGEGHYTYEELNLKNVVKIGAYAFSVSGETADVMYPVIVDGTNEGFVYYNFISYVYEVEYADDKYTITWNYVYSGHNGSVAGTLDLSSVEEIGEGAFAYNDKITEVNLGANISSIPDYAFYMCEGLTKVYRSGDEAYGGQTGGEVSYLSDIESVGAYAFAYTKIASLVLHDQMMIGDGAFYMCANLSGVEGLGSAREIGAYAFAYTKIGVDAETLDLSGVEYIGDYAFAYITEGREGSSLVVVFLPADSGTGYAEGEGRLDEIGENPFLGADVTFSLVMVEEFGNEPQSVVSDSYRINGSAYVSNGVLYTVYRKNYVDEENYDEVYVLVTYPVGLDYATYTVDEGTVRISAHAFDGNTALQIVTLPSELTNIGDKAFYGCEGLGIVVFTSYYAPALEEEYDEDYYNLVANYPGVFYPSGYYPSYEYGYWYEGLGIIEYTMWSVGPNNYFYGATFVDYIGKIDTKLTMIAPVNGQNYDSFTLAQYFDTVIYGAAAATADTMSVIAMIEALPSTISLSDADAVNAALAAYNALPLEQQALVDNYSKLTSCVGQLNFLESLQTGDEEEETAADEKSSSSFMKDNMWGLIIALVILLAFVALLVYTILTRRNKAVAAEAAEIEGTAGEEDKGALEDSTDTQGADAPEEGENEEPVESDASENEDKAGDGGGDGKKL